MWFLKRSLNAVSAILKYCLSGLLGLDTTALYVMFAVKHLSSCGHSALFLQLHLWVLVVGCIILRLQEAMTESIFLQQLQLNFIVCLLKVLDILCCFGKWRLINSKNLLPKLVFTIYYRFIYLYWIVPISVVFLNVWEDPVFKFKVTSRKELVVMEEQNFLQCLMIALSLSDVSVLVLAYWMASLNKFNEIDT